MSNYRFGCLVMAALSLGSGVLGMSVHSAGAQTCTANCRSRQIQFTPGQHISVHLLNRTSSLVQVEQLDEINPVPLLPGETLQLPANFGTQPNVSVVFWDETALPVRAVLFRPAPNTLRIEIRPGGRPPGDRSVYVENDGKVSIY